MIKICKTSVVLVVAIWASATIGTCSSEEHDHDHGIEHSHGNCTYTAARECDQEAHHLHCHDPDDDSIHLCIGDSISLKGKCQQMTCVHHDGDVVLIRGCHAIYPKPGCHLSSQDNSKDYPDCCPKEVCN